MTSPSKQNLRLRGKIGMTTGPAVAVSDDAKKTVDPKEPSKNKIFFETEYAQIMRIRIDEKYDEMR